MATVNKVEDLVNRAFHTFWQTAVVVFGGGLLNVLTGFQKGLGAGKAAVLALVLGAVAAGLSAVKTAYLQNKL